MVFIAVYWSINSPGKGSAIQDLDKKQEITRITQALEEMKAEAGDAYDLEKVNLAELERRTGVSRQRLRRLKLNRFEFLPHGNSGKVSPRRGLDGFTGTLDALLKSGITNSTVCLERLQVVGYGLFKANGYESTYGSGGFQSYLESFC